MRKFYLFLYGFIFTVLMVAAFLVGCGSGSDSDSSGGGGKHCTNTAYPLWCSNAKVCCTPGYAHYCDGKCYNTECPSSTINRDNCYAE